MKVMKNNLSVGTLVLIAVALFALPARSSWATLIEGFESGTLAPGSTVGDAGIRSPNYFGILPTEGTRQLLLTTINNTSDPGYTNQSGANAVSVTAIASFLGIPTGSIRDGIVPGQEGSAFKLNLGFLNVGDVVTFNYNFLTDEVQPGAHNDFAFVSLSGIGGNTPVVADTFSTLFPTTGSGNPFVLETHYQTYTISITTAGTYVLGIGVVDGTTTDSAPTALLVDNIQVIPVPEPSTFGLALVGAGLLVALRRRIKRTS